MNLELLQPFNKKEKAVGENNQEIVNRAFSSEFASMHEALWEEYKQYYVDLAKVNKKDIISDKELKQKMDEDIKKKLEHELKQFTQNNKNLEGDDIKQIIKSVYRRIGSFYVVSNKSGEVLNKTIAE